MNPLQIFRQKIEADYHEALLHLAWLEAYEKRMPGNGQNGQQVMEPIVRAAQTMPAAPPTSPDDSINRSALIDEAIANARGEFTVHEVISFIQDRHPGLKLSRKYISFMLYKREKTKNVRLVRKGLAGKPNYYAKISSAANGHEKGEAT